MKITIKKDHGKTPLCETSVNVDIETLEECKTYIEKVSEWAQEIREATDKLFADEKGSITIEIKVKTHKE